MSAFEQVLQRARKHRRTGPRSAIISCPAAGHEDRHPSVTVTEIPDGTVLMNCRSRGCDFADMVAGLGMQMQEFFPPKLKVVGDYRPAQKRVTPAGDILSALGDEIAFSYLVIHGFHSFILSQGAKGDWPDGTTMERFGDALDRIQAGATEATGRKIAVEEEREAIIRAAQLRPDEERDIDDLRDRGVSLGRSEKRKAVNV